MNFSSQAQGTIPAKRAGVTFSQRTKFSIGHVTFFISIAVAVIAVIIHYAKIDIPHVHSGFVILLIGYLVLVAGNVLDGV